MNRFAYLALGLLLLVALWAGGWFYFAGEVRRNVEALASADGEITARLTCERLDVGGFPFRFDIDCAGAEIISGDLRLTMPEIGASALVYRPTHLIAAAQGPATLTDAFTGARNEIAWSGLDASLRLTDWRIERVSLVADDISWTDTLFGEALIASSEHGEIHLIDMPEALDAEAGRAALAGYARFQAVTAPGFAINGGEAELEIELTGLPADIRVLGEPDGLRLWQQADGQLRIVSLNATDDTDYLRADGELMLNDAGQVEGQLRIASLGVVERIEGLFPEPYRRLLLGNPAQDGSYTNTVNFRGGVITSGLMPAGMIPPLF
ncbi:DUF2125 domain-containing protein [Devosia nitrariae]|uniref:DUF2125 domain-containing protein n=1 Tax=Devosia nitrariae TaxID=2071872 RepID=A0ABQ5W315_9HYPH|nr:DUF2125 domain-containing protein [Devosia nitrariae]GLQ54209.1 hypothetical protein GCM10010862_14680 [Devosia nitrariae]